ncbi:MAG: tRNA preQ1(34) S-adenosylmethionine ribosyltransferase-isomerase QueA [Bacteroidia bacterium]|jgi:S-adenosylmethionine:tRNA ribosyltransferase-isomerase|nr:tRNA preQ1(34) S-adenosylmethionine ribosyltransferase-isomerase QueA [Bacteroidia bacterium]
MKLSEFHLELDPSRVAKTPPFNRDECKLMIVDKEAKTIEHKMFKDILEEFGEGDVMVLNNAKVFPARLYGNKEKTGAKIEVFLLRELNQELRLWDVLVDPARKIRVGNKLFFGEDELVAEVIDNTTSRGRTIRFLFDGTDAEFKGVVNKLGHTPIPKYLEREATQDDAEMYQTIFAEKDGAIAPPAAGLHFTKALMMRLEIKGVKFAKVNLNIGLGAFRPVEVEDLTKHKMDSEHFVIQQEAADMVNDAKKNKKRVLAVGSSVMRALESSVSAFGALNPDDSWTDKFIFPPYEPRIANAYLTNFHQPKSTLMMLTSAYLDDHKLAMEVYETAVKEGYNFLCYGDALLIK